MLNTAAIFHSAVMVCDSGRGKLGSRVVSFLVEKAVSVGIRTITSEAAHFAVDAFAAQGGEGRINVYRGDRHLHKRNDGDGHAR